MAISKRLRYEVMRRDGFACTYCGVKAPDATLHVDHVVPSALGGGDEPSNLTTACIDCNAGKSSTPADAEVVAEVDERAERWSEALRRAASEMKPTINPELERLYDTVQEVFTGRNGPWFDIDRDRRTSIRTVYQRGLPADRIEEAAIIAADALHVPISRTFRYFMGICWRLLGEIEARAEQLMAESEIGGESVGSQDDTSSADEDGVA